MLLQNKGWGHLECVWLAYSKQNYILKKAIVLVHHRMTINFPDMAEELLTGTPNYKTNKQNESWHLIVATIKSNLD